MAVTKYLDKTGLTYFWNKIKAWCNSLFALDSAVVHKTGNEGISGTKTFNSQIVGTIGKSHTDYVDMLQTYQSDNGANRSCTIRCTNGDGFNEILIGAHDESNGVPAGLYITNSDGILSGHFNGSLRLTRTQDAQGTQDNSPALSIGATSGTHLELDGNEIMAKASGTTVGPFYINAQGGDVYIGGNTDNYKSVTGRGKGSSTVPVYTNANGIVTACGNSLDVGITGNAATATKLVAPVTINGVSFDGSANITVADDTKVSKSGDTMTGSLYIRTSTVDISTISSSSRENWLYNISRNAADTTHTGNLMRLGVAQGANTKDYRILLAVANPRAGNLPTQESIAGGVDDPDARTSNNWGAIGVYYDYLKNRAYPYCYDLDTCDPTDNSTQRLATNRWVRIATGDFACNAASATKAIKDGSDNVITSYYCNLSTNQTVTGNKIFSGKIDIQNGIVGINKNNAVESANDLWLSSAGDAGKKQLYFTTANSYTKLTDIPSALPTTIESYTVRRNGATDWVVNQILHNTSSNLYFRQGTSTNGGTWSDWKTFAFTDSDITGNAATATKFAAPVTINGVSFDGSSNITIADSTKLPLTGGTLTGDLLISKSTAMLKIKNTLIERGTVPDSYKSTGEISGIDNNNNSTWSLYHAYSTDKSHRISLLCYNGLTTDYDYAGITVGYDNLGNPYTSTLTPSEGDNSSKIATTAFVNTKCNNYLSLSGGTLTGTIYDRANNVDLSVAPTLPKEDFRFFIARNINDTVHTGHLLRIGVMQANDTKNYRAMIGIANPRGNNLPTQESIANGDDDPDAITGNCWGAIGVYYDYLKNRAYPYCYGLSTCDPSDNSTERLATNRWVRTATGNFACNAATASAFNSSKNVTLTGAVTGTASSTGGWSISTTWRSCIVGRTDSGTSNPWYKVAARNLNGNFSTYCITFYIENINTTNKAFGVLRASVATNGDKTINSSVTKFTWLINDGFAEEDFVLVCPVSVEPTVELWTKVAVGYLRKRFVVISEGGANYTGMLWTLFDTSTAGQSASITTEGTQVVSSPSSLEQRIKALEEAMNL